MAASACRLQGLSCRIFCNYRKAANNEHLGYGVVVYQAKQGFHQCDRLCSKKPQESFLEDLKRTYDKQFVPITRRSIVRHLSQEDNLLNEDENKNYMQFATALNSAVINKYGNTHQGLKVLFDPINPDKDTLETRAWNHKARMDNEFWLMNNLSDIMAKANFTEVSYNDLVNIVLKPHTKGVLKIKVDGNKYDVLRVWVLGVDSQTSVQGFAARLLRLKATESNFMFKRVVVAIRIKKDDKLTLKAFRDVPVMSLEKLLPEKQIAMPYMTSIVTRGLHLAAAFAVLAEFTNYLASHSLHYGPIACAATALLGATYARSSFLQGQISYHKSTNQLHFYNNLGNNRSLLDLLVDRAEDELFKEALLVYTFLLCNRGPLVQSKPSAEQSPEDLGNLTAAQLQDKVDKWVHEKTGSLVDFDSTVALKFLTDMGLIHLNEETSCYHVLPLQAAIRNLPLSPPPNLLDRDEESDIIEGYDKNAFDKSRV